jgi:hypothetical protein
MRRMITRGAKFGIAALRCCRCLSSGSPTADKFLRVAVMNSAEHVTQRDIAFSHGERGYRASRAIRVISVPVTASQIRAVRSRETVTTQIYRISSSIDRKSGSDAKAHGSIGLQEGLPSQSSYAAIGRSPACSSSRRNSGCGARHMVRYVSRKGSPDPAKVGSRIPGPEDCRSVVEGDSPNAVW